MEANMMKSVRVFSMAAAALLAAAPGALANDAVKVTVPFDFVVAGQALPSGDYLFVRGDNPRIVQVLRGGHTHVAVALGLAEPSRSLATELTFHRYGQQYFLKTVSGNGLDLALPKTQAERVAEAALGGGKAIAVR
jgi:hypothetical protein